MIYDDVLWGTQVSQSLLDSHSSLGYYCRMHAVLSCDCEKAMAELWIPAVPAF